MAHAPTTRPKVAIGGDEEATATLSLGEFTHVPSLSNSEARVLINAVLDQRRRKDPNRAAAIQETETLVKTQDYLDTFARFKAPQNIEQVERLLRDVDGLESFERSQLGTLCCEFAEEAKTLIPSLTNKISDADLQSLLQEINNIRQFVE